MRSTCEYTLVITTIKAKSILYCSIILPENLTSVYLLLVIAQDIEAYWHIFPRLGHDISVYTGTHGILTFPDINNNSEAVTGIWSLGNERVFSLKQKPKQNGKPVKFGMKEKVQGVPKKSSLARRAQSSLMNIFLGHLVASRDELR